MIKCTKFSAQHFHSFLILHMLQWSKICQIKRSIKFGDYVGSSINILSENYLQGWNYKFLTLKINFLFIGISIQRRDKNKFLIFRNIGGKYKIEVQTFMLCLLEKYNGQCTSRWSSKSGFVPSQGIFMFKYYLNKLVTFVLYIYIYIYVCVYVCVCVCVFD